MLEVINRACGRCEVKNEIHVVRQKDVVRDVVFDELVVLIARKVLDVCGVAGNEVVDPDDAVAFCEKAISEVGTEESGAAGDDGGGAGDWHGRLFYRLARRSAMGTCGFFDRWPRRQRHA